MDRLGFIREIVLMSQHNMATIFVLVTDRPLYHLYLYDLYLYLNHLYLYVRTGRRELAVTTEDLGLKQD